MNPLLSSIKFRGRISILSNISSIITIVVKWINKSLLGAPLVVWVYSHSARLHHFQDLIISAQTISIVLASWWMRIPSISPPKNNSLLNEWKSFVSSKCSNIVCDFNCFIKRNSMTSITISFWFLPSWYSDREIGVVNQHEMHFLLVSLYTNPADDGRKGIW